MGLWSTACPDWERRLLAGEPLVPELPLFRAEADRALRIFRRLRLPDVIGNPTMAEASGEWFLAIVAALFGSYDVATNRRMIQELFLLVPKKNGKSSYAAAIMVVAMIVCKRPAAEFLLIAPTKEIADIAFKQAAGIIKLDASLDAIFKPQRHIRTITHLNTGTTLQIKAAATDVITGSKSTGILIDETHEFAKKANAADVFLEIRGALAARPDGFMIQISTQSKDQPAGVFAAELAIARDVRDGKLEIPLLPVLYELPTRLSRNDGWKAESLWPLVNPNLGRSVDKTFLQNRLLVNEKTGPAALALFASQHFNVEIGVAMRIDGWQGAAHWEKNAEPGLDLDALIARCEVAVVGGDGGGLDDLLGLAVMGRERARFGCKAVNAYLKECLPEFPLPQRERWLLWTHAWCHSSVLELRKDIAPALQDFAADGDLTIVERVGDDVVAFADIVKKIADAGLLPDVKGIGVDPAGIGEIVEALSAHGFDARPEAGVIVGIPQGWKLNGAIKTLERKLAGGDVRHGGSRLMNWCAGNAKVEQHGNAVSVTKQTSGKAKIDPLSASFDATALMMLNPEAARYTADHGLLIVAT